MKKLAAVGVVLALIAGAAFYLINRRVTAPYRGYSTPEQIIEIPSGIGPNEIGRRLVTAGVIRDQATFRLALSMSRSARRLQAGDYRFDRPMSVSYTHLTLPTIYSV